MKKVLETVVENQGKHLLSNIYEENWKFLWLFLVS